VFDTSGTAGTLSVYIGRIDALAVGANHCYVDEVQVGYATGAMGIYGNLLPDTYAPANNYYTTGGVNRIYRTAAGGSPIYPGNLAGSGSHTLAENTVDSAIYFGACDNTPYPFDNLVFDLSQASVGITYVWEYLNTSDAWTPIATGMGGNFSTLSGLGHQIVSWRIPGNWKVATIFTGSGSGYWIRCRTASVAFTNQVAIQQPLRPVYTCRWNYIEADVLGDLPALARLTYKAMFPPGSGDGVRSMARVFLGVRSTSRGKQFQSYINLADRGNNAGVTVSLPLASFTNSLSTMTGRRCYTELAAGASPVTPLCTVHFDGVTANDFAGRHRLLLLMNADEGASVDDIAKTGFCARVLTNEHLTYTPLRYLSASSAYMGVLDLGEIRIPRPSRPDLSSATSITVCTEKKETSEGVRYYFSAIVLIPADEWSGEMIIDPIQSLDIASPDSFVVDSVTPGTGRMIRTYLHNDNGQESRIYLSRTGGGLRLPAAGDGPKQVHTLWASIAPTTRVSLTLPSAPAWANATVQCRYKLHRGSHE
jgi:hypothetical protein